MLNLPEIFADFKFTSYREVGRAFEMSLAACGAILDSGTEKIV